MQWCGCRHFPRRAACGGNPRVIDTLLGKKSCCTTKMCWPESAGHWWKAAAPEEPPHFRCRKATFKRTCYFSKAGLLCPPSGRPVGCSHLLHPHRPWQCGRRKQPTNSDTNETVPNALMLSDERQGEEQTLALGSVRQKSAPRGMRCAAVGQL